MNASDAGVIHYESSHEDGFDMHQAGNLGLDIGSPEQHFLSASSKPSSYQSPAKPRHMGMAHTQRCGLSTEPEVEKATAW